MSEADLMRLAIEKTREGIAAGQSPFGAVIVKDGEVVASTHNTVWRDTDPTAHAEVNCLRRGGDGPGDDRPEGLHAVLDLRALPDVPGGDPLGEDRPRRLRRHHRRRRRRRASASCTSPPRPWPRWAGARSRSRAACSARSAPRCSPSGSRPASAARIERRRGPAHGAIDRESSDGRRHDAGRSPVGSAWRWGGSRATCS